MTTGIANWGPIVAAADVDDAVTAVMQEWLQTYLKHVSEVKSLGYVLPPPKFYGTVVDVDQIADYQMPSLIVTTAKASKTIGGANSIYQATWEVKVSSIIRGRTADETRRNAAYYEAAVRSCFLNKCRKNDSPLSNPEWKGTEVGPLPQSSRKGRYLAAGIGIYNVSTDAAAQGFGGPDVPNADQYLPLATVTEVDISVQPESEG